MFSTQYLIVMINRYVTGFCIYYTVLPIIALECTVPTYYRNFYCTTVCPVRSTIVFLRLLSMTAQVQQPNATKI